MMIIITVTSDYEQKTFVWFMITFDNISLIILIPSLWNSQQTKQHGVLILLMVNCLWRFRNLPDISVYLKSFTGKRTSTQSPIHITSLHLTSKQHPYEATDYPSTHTTPQDITLTEGRSVSWQEVEEYVAVNSSKKKTWPFFVLNTSPLLRMGRLGDCATPS